MKKLLLLTLLITGLTINAQTTIQGNLIINSDIIIGSNCGQGQPIETIIYTGDLNFNTNSTITLKGVDLRFQGNINGTGTITNHCSNKPSTICYTGWNNSGSNITYNGVTLVNCSTLSSPIFNIQSDFGYEYEIYNTNSQLIKSGYTDQYIYESLPKNQLFFIKVKGFSPDKFIIQE